MSCEIRRGSRLNRQALFALKLGGMCACTAMALGGSLACTRPTLPDGGTGDAGLHDGDDGGSLGPFALGVEYAEPGLAAPFGAAGVTWAKTRLETFAWGKVEPRAPVGGIHTYDWTCTDQAVRDYQSAGLIHLQSYLTPSSPWASQNLLAKDIMPKAQYLDDYEAWVVALFERYDADGTDDMPALVRPIKHWVVAGEWTGFWGSGDADDYIQLLTVTRRAAKAADASLQVGLIPFLLADVFEGNPPSAGQIATKLQDPPPWFRNSSAGMMKILDRTDLYDFVDFHSLGHYTEVPSTLAWFREELRKRGTSKPLWIDDAFPHSMLANGTPSGELVYPVTSAQKPAVYELILRVADLAHPGNAEATAWLRALVATEIVHKVVVAAGEGAAAIQMGNTEDWALDTQVEGLGGRKQSAYLIGAAAFMGLVDSTHPNGYEPCRLRTPGKIRPAYRNLELLASKLLRFEKAERLLGPGKGGWAYRFTREGKSLVVAWAEDDVLQLPGETEAAVEVTIPVGAASQARVTWAVTDVSAPAPRVETLAVVAGAVTLQLTSVPAFIEPL